MSLYSDREALLIEKNARLEAQLEVAQLQVQLGKAQLEIQQLKSAARIKELEQQLSAGKPESQAAQPVISTAQSDPALRADITQLQEQVAERDEWASALLDIIRVHSELFKNLPTGYGEAAASIESRLGKNFDKLPRAMVAAIEDIDREQTTKAADAEREPTKQLTHKVSITDTNNSIEVELPLVSPPKRVRGDSLTRPHTASQEMTPAKLAADSPKPTAPPQPRFIPAGHNPLEKQFPERTKRNQALLPVAITHAEFSAKRKAEEQDAFEPQKQRKFLESNQVLGSGLPTGHRSGRWRGRRGGPVSRAEQMRHGDSRSNKGSTLRDPFSNMQSPLTMINEGQEATELNVPVNLGKRAKSEVTVKESLVDKVTRLRDEALAAAPRRPTRKELDLDSMDDAEIQRILREPSVPQKDRFAGVNPVSSAENGPQSTAGTKDSSATDPKQSNPSTP